jgi:YHS domain-containing protein
VEATLACHSCHSRRKEVSMGILDIFRKKPATAIDPVCHMTVEKDKASATSEYEGETYYFCAPACKQTFDEDPSKYIGADKPAVEM